MNSYIHIGLNNYLFSNHRIHNSKLVETRMSIENEIIKFLKDANLSTYETKAYISLLKKKDLTARKLSEASEVPTGRIYEILEDLYKKGMIEIQDSRPKKYRALPFNTAFDNLIKFVESDNSRKISFLINEAKDLETRIYNSDLLIKQAPSKRFWSTAFGLQSIMALYINHIDELNEELLMTGFINERTPKIINLGKQLFDSIYNAVERGVRVKYLWSFEYDNRILLEDEIDRCKILIGQAKKKLESMYGGDLNVGGFEMKFIYRRILIQNACYLNFKIHWNRPEFMLQ